MIKQISSQRTCMELGVCQNRPGCTVCTPRMPVNPVPLSVEGPFLSPRRLWLEAFARHAITVALAGAALGLLAGLIAGRYL